MSGGEWTSGAIPSTTPLDAQVAATPTVLPRTWSPDQSACSQCAPRHAAAREPGTRRGTRSVRLAPYGTFAAPNRPFGWLRVAVCPS